MDSLYAPPGHLTTAQVAQVLGTSPGAVRNLVYRGRLTRSGGTERRPWFAARDVAALDLDRRTRQSA
ncbi:helix-turn-helix domain-containing protein [Streptomyces sp. AVP053U2]|uniref:sigma factor-like helix-turn-helix DNA-binding protein n=1 Tax=Streptomyces sp. AVP053U2 TaxID=1737066 RepID=UPI000786252A|nr:helix-turn-helix domain-containing protein [Streptomyces sp. AVP053U2]